MTGNNGDERDPNSLNIGRRLTYIAFMVLGAFVIVPWENPRGDVPISVEIRVAGIAG